MHMPARIGLTSIRNSQWRFLATTSCLMMVLGVAFGGGRLKAAVDAKVDIWVSIPPQAYLVDKIGGAYVNVQVLLPYGQEPHTFQPSPRQLSELVQADLFVIVGMPFEHTVLNKIQGAGARLEIVDCSQGIQRRLMDDHKHHGHDHGHESSTRLEQDPHIWMAPANVLVMARNLCEELEERFGDYRATFRKNLTTFLNEINALDREIASVLEPCRNKTFYVFHPAYGYFSDAYGLHQLAVEVEGKGPTPKALLSLIQRAKKDGVRVVFVQPQFDKRSARSLAQAIDGVVEELDPLAYDVMENYRHMAEAIRRSIDPHFGSRDIPKK